jgi:hypothetical protein
MSALPNIWSLSRKKNIKQGQRMLTVTCSPFSLKRNLWVLHHSHILSFLNANNIVMNIQQQCICFHKDPSVKIDPLISANNSSSFSSYKMGKRKKGKVGKPYIRQKKTTPKQPHCKKDYYQTGYQPWQTQIVQVIWTRTTASTSRPP